MQHHCIFAGIAALVALVAGLPAEASPRPFLSGADLSSLPRVEAAGVVFREHADAAPADLLTLVRARGLDTVRLRVWHTPPDGACSLPEVAAMAARADRAGFRVLLDLHYSDTWADPGHQTPPRAWQGLGLDALADSVRAHTRDVMQALAARGVVPACVQVGNEITGGLLWDTGRVGGAFDNDRQWDNLALLLRAAVAGMDAGLPLGAARPLVMIHTDRGGDAAGAQWFLDGLARRGLEYDLIGVSYYPWWHGPLSALEANLNALAARFGKGVVVVETAYPWTLQWFDATHNLVGQESQLLDGYPATFAGQARFLAEVTRIVRAVPDGLGRGVVWWEPAWVAGAGPGSAWENMGWLDAEGVLVGGPAR